MWAASIFLGDTFVLIATVRVAGII